MRKSERPLSQTLIPAARPSRPRRKSQAFPFVPLPEVDVAAGEHFVGPHIPAWWLIRAYELGPQAVAVGLILWDRCWKSGPKGKKPATTRFASQSSDLRMTRATSHTGLRLLESGGLVSVRRFSISAPVVTIQPFLEPPLEDVE